eukprot:2513349-Rhodomonas_salina.1
MLRCRILTQSPWKLSSAMALRSLSTVSGTDSRHTFVLRQRRTLRPRYAVCGTEMGYQERRRRRTRTQTSRSASRTCEDEEEEEANDEQESGEEGRGGRGEQGEEGGGSLRLRGRDSEEQGQPPT